MNCLGLDIGGANLKAANLDGWAKSVPFALWRAPDGLADALRELIAAAPPAEQLAVTMTGELCDCFPTKTQGVRHILNAVNEVADGRDVFTYLCDGRYVSLAEALELPHLAAASNWRALAEFACQLISKQTALLIDIGSTTTDVIPIVNGRVAARGLNDTERMVNGELVYSGVGRTPVCALTNKLPYRGIDCPVAAEVFATTADAYVVLGERAEDPLANWTADGRPLTVACSSQRLARQICSDAEELKQSEIEGMAAFIHDVHIQQIAQAVRSRMEETPANVGAVVTSGSGEFLARKVVARLLPNVTLVSLSNQLGEAVSACATAYAVAAVRFIPVLRGAIG